MTVDELAANTNGALTDFDRRVEEATAFAKGKNALSTLESLKAQAAVLAKIRARQVELLGEAR